MVLIDLFDYVSQTQPVELSDFILSLMAALSHEIAENTQLKPLEKTYWQRLDKILRTEVEVNGVDVKLDLPASPLKLGMKLKTEVDFKQQVQARLRGHLSSMAEEARRYVFDLVKMLRDQADDEALKVVLLVDSFEQIRGSGIGDDVQQIHQSVMELFHNQADNLSFPFLHVVYTIPPFLPALAKNLGRNLGGHSIVSWPNIHVRKHNGDDDLDGLKTMQTIIEYRFAEFADYINVEQLNRLAKASGGDIRNFFLLIRECIIALLNLRTVQADAMLDDEIIQRVEDQLLNDMMPLAEEDAQWLAKVHESKEAALPSTNELPILARFLDQNLIMNYLNGHPWYDIHPLLIPEIQPYLNRDLCTNDLLP